MFVLKWLSTGAAVAFGACWVTGWLVHPWPEWLIPATLVTPGVFFVSGLVYCFLAWSGDAIEVEPIEAAHWKLDSPLRRTFAMSASTSASLMIASNVNAKALSVFMGYSSVVITLDRYAKPFPGNEEEAAGLLDAYLDRANTAARLAMVGAEV